MIELHTLKGKKGLSFICMNARSLYKKRGNAFKIITSADIVGIVETWLNPTHNDIDLYVPGYQYIRLDRYPLRDKGAGGVMIYLRDNYIVSVDTDASCIHKEYEILCVDVEIGVIKYKIYVCYRPPDADNHKDVIYNKLSELKKPVTKNRKIIIMGDFNVDLFTKKDIDESGVESFCTNNDVIQIINDVTRPQSGTLLDHIYTNVHNVAEAGTLDFRISDHVPIYMLLKCQRTKIMKKCIRARSYKNYDFLNFKNALTAIDWQPVLEEANVNSMWDKIIDIIRMTLDEMCPVRKIVIPEFTPAWLTPPIIESMRERDRLYGIARRSMDLDDWHIADFHKNRVEGLIFNSRRHEIDNLIAQRRDDPTKFWQAIRKLLPIKTCATLIKLRNKSDGLIIPPEDCAEHINNYFSTIGEKLAEVLPTGGQYPNERNPYGTPANNKDLLVPLTYMEFMKYIKKINIKKSSSIKHIKTYVIKDAFLCIPEVLLCLYNKCMSTSTFPAKWKAGTVVPLPKKPNSLEVSDLRPISLLPLPGKIMEKIVCSRLQHYMNECDLLSPRQHGYREGHSTQTAIREHLQNIIENTINNKPTISLYLDYKKAFDTVSHSKLIRKLSLLGLSENSISWFKSYLHQRKQKTIANNTLSTEKTITYGVPQGSVLGPVLFSIYINSLPKIYDFDITLYADDAVISLSCPIRMQHAINLISQWCVRNCLTVNEKKTKWMFYNNFQRINPIFTLNGAILEKVDSFTYLGLTLDPELKFIQHRVNTVRNIRNKIVQSARARVFINIPTSLTIYKTMTLPSFDYVDYVWDRGNIGESTELQSLQNKALRMVYKVKLEAHPLYNTVQLHEKSECLFLHVRRDIHLLFYAFTLKSQPRLIDNRNLPTRNNQGIRLKVPRSFKPIVLRSCFYRAIIKWNSLKPLYTLIESLPDFKVAIKRDYNDCFI